MIYWLKVLIKTVPYESILRRTNITRALFGMKISGPLCFLWLSMTVSSVHSDVNLAPNPSFEQDSKRLGGWLPLGPLKDDVPKRLLIVDDHGFQSSRSLRINPGPFNTINAFSGKRYFADYNGGEGERTLFTNNGLTGVRTIALRLDPEVHSVHVRARILGSVETNFKMSLVWTTRSNRRPVVEMHRDVRDYFNSLNPGDEEGGWRLMEIKAPKPDGAVQVQLWIESDGTDAFHLDDVHIEYERRPAIRLWVNQLGYESRSRAKRVILESSSEITEPHPARVIDLDRYEQIMTVDWVSHGYIDNLGGHYWIADFSDVQSGGHYAVVMGRGRNQLSSDSFRIANDLVVPETLDRSIRFYHEQRCGMLVPGVHAACHLDDAKLPDGTWKDLVGGWHDAGDYNKYNGLTPDALRSLTLVAMRYFSADGTLNSSRKVPEDLVEEILWGMQWLDKMLDPSNLKLLDQVYAGYRYWGEPEKETDNLPDTGDERPVRSWNGDRSHLALIYARTAVILKHRGESASREKGELYAELAARLFKENGGNLLALLALSQATGEPEYSGILRSRIVEWRTTGDLENHLSELTRYAVLMQDKDLANELHPYALKRVKELNQLCLNPFKVAMRRAGSGSLIYCREIEDVNDWYVGESAYRLDVAIQGLLAYGVGVEEGKTLAEFQVNWILGCNPLGISMMEGVGSSFVPGYHHRYNVIPGNSRGAVTGAILNGFVRAFPHIDRPWLDLSTEPNADYHSNEPWLLQNNRWMEVLALW